MFIKSFKKWFTEQFEADVHKLLMEMGRKKTGDTHVRVPIFDKYDKDYYGYIIENAQKKYNDKQVLAIVRQAICLRYGAGMIKRWYDKDQDYIDYIFSFKGAKFALKNIPMFPRQVIEKCIEYGWSMDEIDHDFGYQKVTPSGEGFSFGGNCSGPDMNKKAQAYIDYFKSDRSTEPIETFSYYHKKATGAVIAKPKTEEGDITPRSKEKILLDDEDTKFLASFEEVYKEKYVNEEDLWVTAGKVYGEMLPKAKQMALAVRYSDYYITQNKDGEFIPRIGDFIYGPIEFSMPSPRKMYKNISLEKIYVNIPHLIAKFEKYKFSRNFVTKPIIKFGSSDYRQQNSALQTIKDWLEKGTYSPRHTEIQLLPDREFYEIISQDHDLWRENGEIIEGEPIDDPKLLARLTWRRGNLIVEAPNIADSSIKRDANLMSWYELLENDAEIGVVYAKKIAEHIRIYIDKNYNNAYEAALTYITVENTGDKDYRSEKRRMSLAMNAVKNMVTTELKNKDRATGEGGPEAEEGGLGISTTGTGDDFSDTSDFQREPTVVTTKIAEPTRQLPPPQFLQFPFVMGEISPSMARWGRLSASAKEAIMNTWNEADKETEIEAFIQSKGLSEQDAMKVRRAYEL